MYPRCHPFGEPFGCCDKPGEEARKSLAGALEDMAETNLIQGEALPIPDPTKTDTQAEIEEPIYVVIHAGNQVSMQVATK